MVDSRSDRAEERAAVDAPLVAEPFRGLRAERVERADGSYALYFSWPPVPSMDVRDIGPEDADV